MKARGEEVAHVGHKLCECTARESVHQKVKHDALVRETARIEADPKAKIEDPALLASFHVCTMEVMERMTESDSER